MPAIAPDRFVCEDSSAGGALEPDRTRWLSRAGGPTQFGAVIEALQPGSRSSIRQWHRAEDEPVYVLGGNLTLIEGNELSHPGAGDAATFKAGAPVDHCLENRNSATARCRRTCGSAWRAVPGLPRDGSQAHT